MKETNDISIATVAITPQIGFYATKYTVYPVMEKVAFILPKLCIKIHNRRRMQKVGKFSHNSHSDTGSYFHIFSSANCNTNRISPIASVHKATTDYPNPPADNPFSAYSSVLDPLPDLAVEL